MHDEGRSEARARWRTAACLRPLLGSAAAVCLVIVGMITFSLAPGQPATPDPNTRLPYQLPVYTKQYPTTSSTTTPVPSTTQR
ncbi:hypothetical protein AB0H76_04945 [Nocardia sp. NPDC050712]|uniref:hypothetical protein n=1 Tax=Nocardia sp. NPDC050712 TaxID=3155518 RepID=UPI0033ECCFBF